MIDGPIRGLEMNDASIEICDRRGIQGQGMWGRAESLWLLYDAGRWDDLLDVLGTLLPWVTAHGDTVLESIGLSYRARVLANRGLLDGLDESMQRILPVARQVGDLQVQAPVFVAAAIVADAGGDATHALEHVREFEETTRDGPTEYRELQSPEIDPPVPGARRGRTRRPGPGRSTRPRRANPARRRHRQSTAGRGERGCGSRGPALRRRRGVMGLLRRPVRARACPGRLGALSREARPRR